MSTKDRKVNYVEIKRYVNKLDLKAEQVGMDELIKVEDVRLHN